MSRAPEIRASWTKLTIGTLKRQLPEGKREPVLEALKDVRKELRQLGITAWAPAELHLEVGETMDELLGTLYARDLHREVLLQAFESVLLRPIVAGALRLYGRSPASMMRMAPRIHELISRDAGTLTLGRLDEGAVDVLLDELPPILCERRSFLTSYGATCEAILAYLKTGGTVLRRDEALAEGRSLLEVRW